MKRPMEKLKKSGVAEKKLSSESETVFYLPDSGNSITQRDINSGTLRITANAAINFRGLNEELNIEIKRQSFLAADTPRQGRSDLLRLRKPAMQLLGLKAGERLKFIKNENQYTVQSI